MMNFFWNWLANLLAKPAVTAWLIKRAMKTPYLHLMSADKTEVYMERYWLFNPYPTQIERSKYEQTGKKMPWRFPISIRLHRILVPDTDKHLHDHPFNARTFILDGSYVEKRLDTGFISRTPGKTATLKVGEYHRIEAVSEGGVWTLFVTGKYLGTWGFLVDGQKINYKEYLGDYLGRLKK